MAKQRATCPKCGQAFLMDPSTADAVACPGCKAVLRLPPRAERVAEPPKKRRRKWLVVAVVLVCAVAAGAIGILVLLVPRKTPQDTAAETMLQLADGAIRTRQWRSARQALDRLDEGYTHTRFYKTHRPEIAAVRQRLETETGTKPAAQLRNEEQLPRAADLPPQPKGSFGPMVRQPLEPLDAALADGRMRHWRRRGGEWSAEPRGVVGRSDSLALLTLGDSVLDDFAFEADLVDTGILSGNSYGVAFREVGEYGFEFAMGRQGWAHLSSHPRVRQGRKRVTPGVKLAKDRGISVKSGRRRSHLKIECAGTRVRCYLDGVLVNEAEDSAMLSGRLSLRVGHGEIRFENIRIRPVADAPAAASDELARCFVRRAERVDANAKAPLDDKVRVWSDLAARWPKADGALRAWVVSRRDHWDRVVGQTLGARTKRAQELRWTLWGRAREMRDGRMRLAYPADWDGEILDWDMVAGDLYCLPGDCYQVRTASYPLTAWAWVVSHGDDVRLSFRASSESSYGCTLFGLAGQPRGTGITLTVGTAGQGGLVLGPAGAAPWFRSDARAEPKWRRHEIDVAEGQLVYRYEGKEAFRKRVDLAPHRGRRIILWAGPRADRRARRPRFDDVVVVSKPQRDWLFIRHEGPPPLRRCDQPDARGWLGVSLPGWRGANILQRMRWIAGGGRFALCFGSPLFVPHGQYSIRGGFRDVVLSARFEPLDDVRRFYGGRVGFGFRSHRSALYRAWISPHGGAELERRFAREGYLSWGRETVAASREFRTPPGVLCLVAIVQGKHLELYCNGKLALACHDLAEEAGDVGYEVNGCAAAVHDFKFRLLPTDPKYQGIYGAAPRQPGGAGKGTGAPQEGRP